jgi:hypothetical protein
MAIKPSYQLTLHKSYYDKGFFNLGVEVDRFIRSDSGPIKIQLGESGPSLTGSVNRDANQNGTPRIMGGTELRNWIQRHFDLKDSVEVQIITQGHILLKR